MLVDVCCVVHALAALQCHCRHGQASTLHNGKHKTSVSPPSVFKLKGFKMSQAITFDWSNNAWAADQLTDRKTAWVRNAVCMLQPLCVAEQGSEADLSLCHTARRLSHSVALLALQQDWCPCQRNPEDASIPLRGDNAEVAMRELIDASDGHTMQGSWQHRHFGVVSGLSYA